MAGKTEFTRFELCELLTSSEVAAFGGGGAGAPTNSPTSGDEACQWMGETSLVIDFGANMRSGNLKKGPNITMAATTVDGLTGVQSHDLGEIESCQVIVDITDHSTLAFGVAVLTSGEGKYEPCDVANRLANTVISKIKKV